MYSRVNFTLYLRSFVIYLCYATDYIRPICLPSSSYYGAKVGDTLYTTGWGQKTKEGDTAEFKKKIKSTWLPNEECDNNLDKRKIKIKVTDYRICTKDFMNGTEFSCSGDSGSSVMSNRNNQWFLEGLVSQGTICGPDAINMNTRISKYLEWISENMKSIR